MVARALALGMLITLLLTTVDTSVAPLPAPLAQRTPAPKELSGDDSPIGPLYGRSAASLETFERSFPASVPPDAFVDGVRQADNVTSAPAASWQELGPSYVPAGSDANPRTGARLGIGGRVTALAVDPSTCTATSCATIYVGAAEGGLWRTTDAGQTWTALLNGESVQRISSIALDPVDPNILYVGTGDVSMGNGAQAGLGLLRSTDGGRTWQSLGIDVFGGTAIDSLAIDPRTAGGASTVVYAGTTAARTGSSTTDLGSFYADTTAPPWGLWISRDSGQTWSRAKPANVHDDPVGNLALDPSNPAVLDVTFDGKGIYQTGDGGRTWAFLTRNVLTGKHFDHIRLAVSPSDPHVLYAAFEVYTRTRDYERIFRSVNGGLFWKELAKTPNACGSQCYENMLLAVDPTRPDTVYAGGTANYGYLNGTLPSCNQLHPLLSFCGATIMKSTNAGKSWADIAENGRGGPIHVDDHVILIDPENPRVIYAGTDGGLYHSADGGKTWDDLNHGLATFETQSIAIDPAGNVYTGAQDNGTLLYRRATHNWDHIADGDGGQTAADPTNRAISYNAEYGPYLRRNDHYGAPYRNLHIDPFYGDYQKLHRGNFYEPYTLAPSNPKDIFFGTFRLWRSENRGGYDGNGDVLAFDSRRDKNDWVPISFDLSCGSVPKNLKQDCHYAVSAIAVSPDHPNVVAAASDNGYLWLTTNALAKVRTDVHCEPWRFRDGTSHCFFLSGVRWHRIDAGLPRRFPTSIAFFPHSTRKLIVSFSGYDQNTPKHAGHIFLTTNGGKTWKTLTGTTANARLPDLPFADVIVNPANGRLYAAADYGLFASTDGGTTWFRFDRGLPSTSTYQMVLTAGNTQLDIATYGRGIWETVAP